MTRVHTERPRSSGLSTHTSLRTLPRVYTTSPRSAGARAHARASAAGSMRVTPRLCPESAVSQRRSHLLL
ncbi:hypothetical protein EXIGLDRAFT_716045 [Exidia glandulosa HHB12029]|uniref:Uncharacterized protein n=1 Tax=Exidia glandulosa HHB12029 TaxID=1314781 RepID=A0A165QSV6_EXIGL|nr:hypothetical protein EXIGLDRAFT_716042 [Exidia glandulosa HHB12029]KZW04028.1 hypothetical protein EXIGLDRAFT_716045 [Exidia glandulosa HHB12029]